VRRVNSRTEFAAEIKSTLVVHNDSGRREITVVNIQKFKDDPDVTRNTDYNLGMQRIYFLDEVHRSYNPKGSFLANLKESDPNAINIGLTGTPLLGDDYNSKDLFGNYIHKYYYNASIKDGYTLRLIREEIETKYKLTLAETLENIRVLRGEGSKKELYAHPVFAEALLDYIVEDFENSRIRFGDNTIGGMVVCDSSDQAKAMFKIFNEKYAVHVEKPMLMAADPAMTYSIKKKEERKVNKAAVILHDVGTKSDRKEWVDSFKAGNLDLLFVYNMLLTGFDARRLKKLYLGRVVKSHNLLQTLTRVNRTYKDFRYGYVVDFADIQSEFDKTNKAYFDELQAELGDEMQHYSDLFLKADEIEAEIEALKDALFHFNTENAEIFTQQVNEINDRKQMLDIVKALNTARSLYNLIRLTGNYDLLEKLDFKKLTQLAGVAEGRLTMINQKAQIESGDFTSNLLNVALENVVFAFTKVREEEMVLADALKDILRKTRESLSDNFDKASPQFISLREELERLFKKKNLNEVTKEEMEANIEALKALFAKAKEDDRKNRLLRAKYANDAKYARIHKRLMEKGEPTKIEALLFEALNDLKQAADAQILQNARMLSNEGFVERMLMKEVIEQFENKHHIDLTADETRYINKLVVREYLNEYNGAAA
jgi:type I restriction enzyme R subunit